MKISVITVVKDSVETIEKAILSVLGQKNADIEYIVCDACSDDGTEEILYKYKDKIDMLISEEDDGSYFALNKCIKYASGDIIAILNSDDYYNDEDCLSHVVELFESRKCSIVYGDIDIVNRKDNKVLRRWCGRSYKSSMLYRGWSPPHPAFFALKKLYQELGLFDTSYHIASDYDLMVRFLKRSDTDSVCFTDKVLVIMSAGGISSNKPLSFVTKLKEDFNIIQKNRLCGIYTLVMKKVIKIFQFRF